MRASRLNKLWELDQVERSDAERAAQLRTSPPWPQLIHQVRHALRVALASGDARFAFDQSSRDKQDLRAILQFPVGCVLFDRLFNGHEGYRAQFRAGRENGLAQNAKLISELCAELNRSAPSVLTGRLLSHDFKDKGPVVCNVDEFVASMDPHLSKIWVCEQLIGKEGGIQELLVSRSGPKLIFTGSEPWSSLFPEDSAGWLDVKGAFVSPAGKYQLKSPQERAAGLEKRGSA